MTLPDILILLRAIVLVLAGYIVWWAGPFTFQMMRGCRTMRHIYRSALFFFAAGGGLFQLLALTERANDATRLMFLLLILIGLGLSCWIVRLAPRYDELHRALDHLGDGMALVDLARVDPEAARQVADDCRARLAKWMIAHG